MGSIGAHLISEFAAMGSDAEAVTFSLRHLYLGLAGLAALIVAVREVLVLQARASSRRDAKRLAEIALQSLPFSGKGHFWLATAGLQLAIGGFTEIGEGCPLCGHDVVAGFGGALIVAVLLSLVARALTRRLPSIASAMIEFVSAGDQAGERRTPSQVAAPIVVPNFVWLAHLFNRPPPALQPAVVTHR